MYKTNIVKLSYKVGVKKSFGFSQHMIFEKKVCDSFECHVFFFLKPSFIFSGLGGT